jgi:DNA-directed RNA polymerase specialized sigma24 family protein
MASSRFADALFFKTEAQSQEKRGTPMSDQQATIGNFHADLKMILPRLRIYALSLTRDSDRADDLMQRTVVKALTGRKSFQSGTNFPGWLFRIQRNEFISGLRSRRYGRSQSYYSPSGYGYAPSDYSYVPASNSSYSSRSDFYRNYNGIHAAPERTFP